MFIYQQGDRLIFYAEQMAGFVLGEYWHSETDTTGCYFYSTLMYFLIAYTLLLVRRCRG
ncbi:hypothetical protein ABE354_25100 [Brevibacillus laterosporus]|uniref:hypothetical protein n=1 Tax=Brevibacillus laterosporus TaxID=1465 RepID=UPI0038153AD3|nr:hypothetical protein [Brevibacillus laterosporus]